MPKLLETTLLWDKNVKKKYKSFSKRKNNLWKLWYSVSQSCLSAVTLLICITQEAINSSTQNLCDFRNFQKRRNNASELTFFYLEKFWMEFKTRCKDIQLDAAWLSGAKPSVSHRRLSPKKFENVLSHSSKKLVAGYFLYLWKSLVFLRYSIAAHLLGTKTLVSRRMEYHKKLLKTFCFWGIFRERAPLKSLKVSGTEKVCLTEVPRFASKLFCLTVPKNFVMQPFCVVKNFQYQNVLWILGGIMCFCRKFP